MDPEKGSKASEPRVVNPAAEAAAAKIWAVYIAEAERYDKALVESWKSDMEGMLIFAGLFSASLTAFLIESYKTLNPDQGDTAIRLLAQISDQLAASTSGTAFNIQPTAAFTPSTSALVCNTLWFLSLGLSLTCALVATLLEQWARDFIHRSEIHSAPLIRARIFSFLYYGLKRFSMHTVVEIIPLLLHTSLFLFFAGLVAFLVPVNIAMAVLAGAMLTIVAGVYSLLTVLPLQHLDSPYRTPLSGTCWCILQKIHQYWQHQHTTADIPAVDPETIMEAITREATEESQARLERDYRALLWTVKSLSNETELEPFVEGLPDILWQPYAALEQHNPYADHFRRLVNHPEVLLFSRITGLRDSCEVQILSPEAAQHRRIIAYKALWVVGTLFHNHTPLPCFPTPPLFHEQDNELRHFSISASTVLKFDHFKILKPSLEKMQLQLTGLQVSALNASDSSIIKAWFHNNADAWRDYNTEPPPPEALNSDPVLILPLLDYTNHVLRTGVAVIKLRYILAASTLDSLPYQWQATMDFLKVAPPPMTMDQYLESAALTIVSRLLSGFNRNQSEWMDELLQELMPLLPPQWPPTSSIVFAFIHYLAHRKYERALQSWAFDLEEQLDNIWEGLVYVATSTGVPEPVILMGLQLPDRQVTLRAIWRLASLLASGWGASNQPVDIVQRIADIAPLSNATSVSVLLKVHHLQYYARGMTTTSTPAGMCSLLPAETAVVTPPELQEVPPTSLIQIEHATAIRHMWFARAAEARIVLVSEFMEAAVDSKKPIYEVVETLNFITPPYPDAVHQTHQLRLADAMANIFASEMYVNLGEPLLRRDLFGVYMETASSLSRQHLPWLDHTPARRKIQETFTTYAERLSTGDDDVGELAIVRKILEGFDRLHPPGDYTVSKGSSSRHKYIG